VVEEGVGRAVGRMGPAGGEGVPALVRNAGRDCDLDRAINEAVGEILRGPNARVGVANLAEQLKAPNSGDRLRAGKELAQMGVDARGAAAALTEALSDQDPDVRRQAYRALLAVRPGVPPDRAMIAVLALDL